MKLLYRYSHLLLLACIVCGFSLSVTSCKDDDDDNNEQLTPEQREQQAQAQHDRFWDVVGQLTSSSSYAADYQDKTFEPNIGEPSSQNPYVRLVATNDLPSAAQRFAALIGQEDTFDPNTADYEWSDEAVGTLNYHKTDNGSSWAVVDVSIRQMPHLQQIVYCSSEQMGTNKSFNGAAYYRFGDVVKKDLPGGTSEYWICVRPAFGPEGKGTSHWVSLSPLPAENLENIPKNDRSYNVPKGLGTNTEQMQNLAEMLYAMYYPDTWEHNVLNVSAPGIFTSGLRMFHDFSHADNREQYHNQWFWRRVREAWHDQGLFKTIFGFDISDEQFQKFFAQDGGLHLLYKGYSWWNRVSNNLTLYEYTYSTGTANAQLNMHRATKREVESDMTQRTFDLTVEYTAEKPYLSRADLFGNNQPRYIVRHATGQDLIVDDADWDYKQPISGITDVYVYNRYFYENTSNHFCDLTSNKLEVATDPDNLANQELDVYTGNPYFRQGDVIEDESGTQWFCVLNSGSMNFSRPYSYFVTFDDIAVSPGKNPEGTNLIQEETVPIIMASMSYLVSNSLSPTGLAGQVLKSIKDKMNVDLSQMFVVCDSIITTDEGVIDTRSCLTACVLYNNDEHRMRLMRFIKDGTYDKTGNRQWAYKFYTRYEGTNVPMMLSDIADQAMVNQYGPDRWAVLPIHPGEQRRTWRTQADENARHLGNYQWLDGQFVSGSTSMWNEPVLVMRATKVYDRGVGHHGYSTFQDTKIVKLLPSTARSTIPDEMLVGALNMELQRVANRYFFKDGQQYALPGYLNDMYD